MLAPEPVRGLGDGASGWFPAPALSIRRVLGVRMVTAKRDEIEQVAALPLRLGHSRGNFLEGDDAEGDAALVADGCDPAAPLFPLAHLGDGFGKECRRSEEHTSELQ